MYKDIKNQNSSKIIKSAIIGSIIGFISIIVFSFLFSFVFLLAMNVSSLFYLLISNIIFIDSSF